MMNLILALLLTICLASVQGIMWKLEPGQNKCLKEEIQAHVLVMGEYEVSEAPGQKIDYVVSRICHLLAKYI